MIRIFIILLLLSGCSQKQVTSHIGTTAGAVSGYATCRALLNSGIELTAACAVVGAWIGSSMFYNLYSVFSSVAIGVISGIQS